MALSYLILYLSCTGGGHAVGLFAQARDTAQQEEEEEHADCNLRKVTIKRTKKGLQSSTNMDFMKLRTDSYLAR
jgi:hypothetical protein